VGPLLAPDPHGVLVFDFTEPEAGGAVGVARRGPGDQHG